MDITITRQLNDRLRNQLIDFLHSQLDEFRDSRENIQKAIHFAMKEKGNLNSRTPMGGFIVLANENDQVIGAVVVNRTGMDGYIPENILVYIATHKDYRGKGIGKQLMKRTIDEAKGAIKLHVEPDNPAIYLYEKIGFTSKYLEMRYLAN